MRSPGSRSASERTRGSRCPESRSGAGDRPVDLIVIGNPLPTLVDDSSRGGQRHLKPGWCDVKLRGWGDRDLAVTLE
jgi:hypothetical protein